MFVNDRLDVALELGLHLHIGQADMPLARARAALPVDLMVGLSIESEAQLAAALADPAISPDVIGVSPVWSTPTKTDTAPALGVRAADRIARVAGEAGVRSVGIGGVGPATSQSSPPPRWTGCGLGDHGRHRSARAAVDLLAGWDAPADRGDGRRLRRPGSPRSGTAGQGPVSSAVCRCAFAVRLSPMSRC